MSFSRVNPNSWAVGDKFTSAQANALDIQLSNALDKSTAGDAIQGAITLAAAASLSMAVGSKIYTAPNGIQVSGVGGITVATGGSIVINSGALNANIANAVSANAAGALATSVAGGIVLGGGATDFPTFSATRSRSVLVPLGGVDPTRIYSASGVYLGSATSQTGSGGYVPQRTAATSLLMTSPSYAYLLDISAYMHQGATLTSASTTAVVASNHTSLPNFGPGFAILRIPQGGADLTQSSGFAPCQLSSNGNVTAPLPASVGAYNGSSIPMTLTCNQSNVIDKSTYTYLAIFYEEQGGGAVGASILRSLQLNFTSIADMRFQ